jgi:hypothetical protein
MCKNLERTLKTNFSHPRLSGVLVGFLSFFGSLARLNRVSDLMFNAWRTSAAVAALFFPGERGVITLAIKKDAPPSSVKGRMCDRVEQNGLSFLHVVVADSCYWLAFALGVFVFCTREDDGGHHVLIDDVCTGGRVGVDIPHFLSTRNKTNEKP